MRGKARSAQEIAMEESKKSTASGNWSTAPGSPAGPRSKAASSAASHERNRRRPWSISVGVPASGSADLGSPTAFGNDFPSSVPPSE
ncbi:hypothetical protein NDR87_36135 [Nocardia sp. CDC159]|uniref:Uncharacterized protein n=1 Tax=Nocardia pulmonis TaxID=2951408 RepID=A0A9X2EEN7_9NOCA|nr:MULTISPECIES: hypothetical protein [Nocardia]MCM6778940.1 hypothetical protein [Nocardia pulmonis]MCM6791807.1 hypothetical protein [Nocardia sp. CDC159]